MAGEQSGILGGSFTVYGKKRGGPKLESLRAHGVGRPHKAACPSATHPRGRHPDPLPYTLMPAREK